MEKMDPAHEEADQVLTRLAQMVADGDPVDWDAEAVRTPEYASEIQDLRWIEAVTVARRIGLRAETGPSKSTRPARSNVAPVERPAGLRLEPVAAEAAPEPLVPGATWGPLQILERIGRGSAGNVYRAFDPVLGREVALKIWRESTDYRTTGTEARRLSRVSHPCVVAVLGNERHGGLAGMWTDLLDGHNLEEVLGARGPLDVREACVIGIALCDALEAIHAAGMVHRDVKASNVMYLADDSVVLIDFSSVKELPRGVPEHSETIRGAPLSTAPELLRGGPVEPLADIYSLGVLLYRMVTGLHPIEARTIAELIEKVETDGAVPIDVRKPDCDPAFAELVDRAVSQNPGDRPQGAGALCRELKGVLNAIQRRP
jgi:serine/threonine protein kinase